ncbi:MAG: hypothetical protein LBI06_05740 [Treponema sp.]|jgi:hypothetical protein|nr:hypothetical protein [Treponema sp.]
MKRDDGKTLPEIMRIRMSTELFQRILAAKGPAGWGEEADSSFARHLIVLGINEVEQNIKSKQDKKASQFEAETRSHLAG